MPLALVALVFQLQRLEHPGRVRLFSLRSVGNARALGLVGVASCNLPLEHADTTVHDVDHLRRRARLRALDLELRLFLDHVGLALGLAHLDCRLLSTRGDEFILALRARSPPRQPPATDPSPGGIWPSRARVSRDASGPPVAAFVAALLAFTTYKSVPHSIAERGTFLGFLCSIIIYIKEIEPMQHHESGPRGGPMHYAMIGAARHELCLWRDAQLRRAARPVAGVEGRAGRPGHGRAHAAPGHTAYTGGVTQVGRQRGPLQQSPKPLLQNSPAGLTMPRDLATLAR